ncbi:MAG: DMT family transporter [Candidatus Sphingomonas colombiensis]|nr:DMT family transporter [Sphingomonas sp.]WEK44573.1 MAG: DMT family transporter [Sphingomonas sp.]
MIASGAGIALALLSSVTTAAAHALLKAGRDRLAIRALIGAVGAVVLAPVCLFVPLPTAAMLPWLLAANALHTIYQLVLIRSYAANDFAVAYPIARGTAPILTAVLGIAVLGDRIAPPGLLGVALVSGGVMLIAAGRHVAHAGLIAAIAAGLLTTLYTVVDAQAIRLAPLAMTFIAWFFVLDGLIMFPIFAVARRGQVVRLLRAEGRQGMTAGVVTLIAFGSALLALRIAPAGIVSALRETSVLFALLIAVFALGEHVDRRRAIGALVIAAGAVAITLTAV